MEHNRRIFKQQQQSANTIIIRHIIREVHGRGNKYPRIATRLQNLNVHPQ